MSSNVPNLGPANSSRSAIIVRAVRGPVLLITVGILFAVHQAGAISFTRTWPVLIIVLGFMALLERSMAPRSVYPQPPYPGQPYAGQSTSSVPPGGVRQ